MATNLNAFRVVLDLKAVLAFIVPISTLVFRFSSGSGRQSRCKLPRARERVGGGGGGVALCHEVATGPRPGPAIQNPN